MTATKQNIIHVGIDGGDFIPKGGVKSGIQRLVKSFLNSLPLQKSSRKKWFYYYFSDEKVSGITESIIYKNLPRRLFSSFFLPFYVLFDRVRVYLGFSGILPHLVRVFGRKSIIFIHDFGFYTNPQYYRDPERMKWQTEYALYGADRIIVFSDYIGNQILSRFPKISRNKIIRIYPGADHLVKLKTVQWMKEKFFLYVGVIKAAKNIELLFEYFSGFLLQADDKNIKLILIGSKEETYFQKISQSPIYKRIRNNLIFLNDVTDKELVQYYMNCYAVLNVSHEEGFCYPVIEALQLGRQVIVNDIPLYGEFKPFFQSLHIESDKESFINSMQQSVKQIAPPSKTLKSPFIWNTFARELLQVIDKVII